MAFEKDLGAISLSNGETLVLPRLTLGRIISVSKSVMVLLKKIKDVAPELFNASATETDNVSIGSKVLGALPDLLPQVWDEVVGVISDYTGKESSWVKAELDLEDTVNVLFPFFTSIFKQGNQAVSLFNQLAGKTEPTPS